MQKDVRRRLQQALKTSYSIVERIGGGGMGDVYLATHKTLGGKWAVKVLAEDLAKDPAIVDRFINEAKIEANLQHPNIVKVFDVVQRSGFILLIMSFVEGEDLATLLARTGQMPVDESVGIALQVGKALECAHEHGIIHRDLKPSNIRIDRWGTVIVIDFGIARARDAALKSRTALGERLGTPLYMSPEQAMGRPVDVRSDIYSLGVILYEMLSGANPFEAENSNAICMQHLNLVPKPLAKLRKDVPAKLSKIVARMLEKEPKQRQQTAAEVVQALASFGSASGLRTPKPVLAKTPARPAETAFSPEMIVHRVPNATPSRQLSPNEKQILDLVNDARSMGELMLLSALAKDEFLTAFEVLRKDNTLLTRTPEGTADATSVRGAEPTSLPGSQERTELDLESGRSGSRSVETAAAPHPIYIRDLRSLYDGLLRFWAYIRTTVEPRNWGQPVPIPWLKGRTLPRGAVVGIAAGLVVLFTSGGVIMFRGSAKPAIVRVDALPFAKVVVSGSRSKYRHEDYTPFQVVLLPGSYNFEFTNGDKTQSKLVEIRPGTSELVRMEFWTRDRIKDIIQKLYSK